MPKTGVLCIAFTFIGMIGKCQTQRTAIDASATIFSGCLKVKQFKCHKPSPKPLHFLYATNQISPKVHIKTGHPCSSVEPRLPRNIQGGSQGARQRQCGIVLGTRVCMCSSVGITGGLKSPGKLLCFP